MIITRTPFRISFFGGGTDYPRWYGEHGGAVLATTINKYCYISVRKLPPFFEHKHRVVYSTIETVHDIADIKHPAVRAILGWAGVQEGLEIHHDGDLPARSGLGSSSSFSVGLIHAMYAMRGQMVPTEMLAKDAIHIEQHVIGEQVGSQDQISAAFGGFNHIKFRPDGLFKVSPLILRPGRLAELQSHLMLVFSGKQRIAAEIEKKKMAKMDEHKPDMFRMAAMVDEAIAILSSTTQSITEFGKLLHEAWMLKRNLSPAVSTSDIDQMYEEARAAGALGGKVLGAGGGGFMLLFAKPEQQEAIRARLKKIHVPFAFETSGSKVVLYQPAGL